MIGRWYEPTQLFGYIMVVYVGKVILVDKVLGVIPMGRAASEAEVASIVAYLASREAGFITGQVISVNGGATML